MANDRLTIYGTNETIEMPKVRYTLTHEEESEETTMMSGKIVKDILGYRTVISAEWDYVPAADLAKLVKLLRGGEFLEVEYQDTEGQKLRDKFKISQPEPEVFTYLSDGTAVWRSIKLKLTAQEVKTDD